MARVPKQLVRIRRMEHRRASRKDIMPKAITVRAAVLLVVATIIQLVSVGFSEGATQEGNGVTSTSIKVGITYPDVAAIASIINVNPGNYKVAYTTLINQINSRGGINGRKIIPVFAPVDPLGTSGAATACTHLTEDESVFAVMGFFQAADVNCYLVEHDTPIIGASLTAVQSAQAKAPWFNNIISDSDLIPKEMAIFKQEGAFAGKKIGVVGTSPDQAEMNLVIPALHKAKADVIQTAINSVPDTDTVAFNQEYGVIAEKFQSSGVNTVVAVGNAGNSWAEALQVNQSTYHPRIVATDYIDLDAYVTNKLGYKQSIIKDGLTAGGYAPVAVVWDDPAMKRCIAAIQAAEPGATINNPVTATSSTPVTWTAPELACQQMALFSDFVKGAGKTLTNQTLAKGAKSIGKVTIPGGGGALSFPAGHGDGDGPVFVYRWNPTKDVLQLKTTVG
jgi:Periplasmic binding protein